MILEFPPIFPGRTPLAQKYSQPPCFYTMFEISPQIFNNIQVWGLWWPFQNHSNNLSNNNLKSVYYDVNLIVVVHRSKQVHICSQHACLVCYVGSKLFLSNIF